MPGKRSVLGHADLPLNNKAPILVENQADENPNSEGATTEAESIDFWSWVIPVDFGWVIPANELI